MDWKTTKGIKTEEVNQGNAKFRGFLVVAGIVAGLIGWGAMKSGEPGRGFWFMVGGAAATFVAGKIPAKRRLNSKSGRMEDVTWW